VPALLSVKAPGRCRLELAPDGVPPAQRPWVAWRNGAVTGRRGLEAVGAARAMVEAVCVLLGERAESERSLSQRLARHGVDVHEVAFGRLQGRVAWVIGGRQETRAQAWIDKLTFQPARLVASLAGARRDVRLLGFGGPAGGERFPAAVEVWTGGRLEARFSTVTVKVNPPLSDALFQ
jgi:hypothetical protein